MTTTAPIPVDVPTLVTPIAPPTSRPQSVPPGPGTTGRILTTPTPIGPPETAPPLVSPGPATGQSVSTATTSTVPVSELPVDAAASEFTADNITVPQPIYVTVLDEGTIVTRNTRVLNFIGSGVSVTGTSSQANITITGGGGGGGEPGGSNTQIQFNNSGLFGGSANLTFNNSTRVLGVGGNVSATGNIIGSYFIGDGSQLTGLPASYGNSNVATLLAGFGSNTISTTGNITGGNILGGANVNATTHTGATVSVTGNITGSFFIGNGSQLTGIVSSYGNANVAANLAAFGSNPVSTTGNVTAGNFIGNVVGGGAGTPTITSTTNLDLSAVSAVRVIGGGTFRLPTLTTAQIANIVAVNGDMVYNSTTSKIQAYANNAWGNITLS